MFFISAPEWALGLSLFVMSKFWEKVVEKKLISLEKRLLSLKIYQLKFSQMKISKCGNFPHENIPM